MDKVGGFDRYLLDTPPRKLQSLKALQLRELLVRQQEERLQHGDAKTWIDLLPDFKADDVIAETREMQSELDAGAGFEAEKTEAAASFAAEKDGAGKEADEIEVDLSEESAGDSRQ